MKYLPLRDFEDVATALNFDTADLHIVGGCDLYTTKAAGRDKKLYKDIENSLQSQYSSVLKISERLSPDQTESLGASLNLERASPFGPFTKHSARRTFAYLIATLNASHPDYDFSHVLRPTDFRKERHLKAVTDSIDSAIYNLRPRGAAAATTGFGIGPAGPYLSPPTSGHGHRGRRNSQAPQAAGPLGSQQPIWGPRMWRLIDNEMTLGECEMYSYVPDEDPFDGEEGALWSLNYFFFNKTRKRVCYLHLRALSVLSHSPHSEMHHGGGMTLAEVARKRERASWGNWNRGATKRARYWLGDKMVDGPDFVGSWGRDESDPVEYIPEPGDDEVDAESEYDVREERFVLIDDDSDSDDYDVSPPPPRTQRSLSKPSGVSESIADSMEV